MKKGLKRFLIVIGVLVGVVLLDSLQALIFNKRPIISTATYCMSYEGIFVVTYRCGDDELVTTFRQSNNCSREKVCREIWKDKK